MNCFYHPEKGAVAQCVVCRKALCSDCAIIREGQNYCKDCLGAGEVSIGMDKIVLPVLACGALAGILSIVPVLSALNCVFCLWAVLGGALAVYLVKRMNSIKGKISTGKAALTGGLTGVVASIFMLVMVFLSEEFDTAIQEAMQSPEVQEALRESGIAAQDFYGVALVFVVIIMAVLFLIFGALGGVISNEVTK